MSKFLIIQTAFIGDVVLATSVAEKLHIQFPAAQVDFLLRKGNENLLQNHPYIRQVLVWDKQKQKQKNLVKIIRTVRSEKYDYVINLHRFATSGLITYLSGAKHKFGFDKNPFSFCYDRKLVHLISKPYASKPIHEVQRNHSLISGITDPNYAMPALYPSKDDFEKVKPFQQQPYICISPASVWFTKQFALEKWIDLVKNLPADYSVFLLGGKGDDKMAQQIIEQSAHPNIQSLCGQLSFLQSAALMKAAAMNYVNDSAPLHFCTAVNAPVTAVYCSTVPAFGFGPLRENSRIVEIAERLYCRPCGLHGHKACPEGHFRCALDITNQQLLWWTSKTI